MADRKCQDFIHDGQVYTGCQAVQKGNRMEHKPECQAFRIKLHLDKSQYYGKI